MYGDLTPEQLAEMQGAQQQDATSGEGMGGQGQGQGQGYGAGYGQPQYQQQQQPELSLEEQKAEARKLLGVDEMEKQLNLIKENARIQSQQTRKDLVMKRYDISSDDLEKELTKVKEADPVWYEQLIDSDIGMDQVAKGMRANQKPTNKPDDVIDSGGGGGEPQSDVIAKVRKGGLSGDNMFMTLGEMQLS